MTYQDTPQQTACYDFALDPHAGSLAIDAKAGSGKTSTLRQLANRLPGTGLATSFSRSTVDDLKAAMPANWECSGIHALGLRAIKSRLPTVKVDSSGDALYSFCREALKKEDDGWKIYPDIKRLVEVAALSGLVPGHERSLRRDTYKTWEEIADVYDIEFSPIVYETAHAGLIHINNLALKGNIMFIHMLLLPIFYPFPVPQYPKIIVDEAQDLNPLQHRIVAQALRPNGRLFIAGDPHQAIFGFGGAMTDSFSRLAKNHACTTLPLTVSWRCARSIVNEAKKYVPAIEAAPTAVEGEVIPVADTLLSDLPRNILCCNNAPNAALAMRLFLAGYSVECAGRDIGAGFKSTINRVTAVKNADQMPSSEFVSRLHRWGEREIARRPARRNLVNDKVAALSAIAVHHQTVKQIKTHIDNLYVDVGASKRPAEFHLSTIHKAKGREWNDVGFLDSHLLPRKWATQDWELQQESNLSYVGVTRAKRSLTYLDSQSII